MEKNKSVLLNKIQKIHFALMELRLFLNTHPTDYHAIKHYEYYQNLLNELTKEYERIYGPIAPKFSNSGDRWVWCDGPWPWEREYNEGV